MKGTDKISQPADSAVFAADPSPVKRNSKQGRAIPMEFGYTIQYVDDVNASVAFYEKAFRLKRRFIHESDQYAEMETGSTALAFASNKLGLLNFPDVFRRNSISEKPAGIEIVLVTGDVEAAYEYATGYDAAKVAVPK